ncbi:efflux RND transporter periplasmic adaptor subunit [Methylocella sp.]|uniref:efflux RND transporter periplasmic adaptor subunit n=1 Tax=Methylocella sp. TaxID=1978226 RepID=UPI0035B02DF8
MTTSSADVGQELEAPPQGDSARAPGPDPALEKRRRRLARVLGLAALLAAAGLVAFGVTAKGKRGADAKAVMEARRSFTPTVRVVTAKESDAPRVVQLTGNIAAFESATIYARATGYIGERRVDIGSRVKKGDVLAVIAAPDLDQQLAQATATLQQQRAAVMQAKANADLGRITDQRTSQLVAKGWSSAQQGDTDRLTLEGRVAALAVAEANVAAQEAAVSRLQRLADYERVVAPFDGVVTGRLIDVGSLVTADAASGTSLFTIARDDVLRVQVFVPQSASVGIADGDIADVSVAERPGRVFKGKVSRNAEALAPGTRTLLTEVDIENKDGALSPGMYSIVKLKARRPAPVFVVPSQAVIFDRGGMQVAVVKDDGALEMRKIGVALDNGATLDVEQGLKAGDRIVISPPANVANGMKVEVAPEA